MNKFGLCFIFFFFESEVRFYELKFEFYQITFRYRIRNKLTINLQICSSL